MTKSIFPTQRLDPGLIASWREFQATKVYDVLTAAPVILVFGSSGAHLAKGLLATLMEADFSSFDPIFAISLLREAIEAPRP